MLFKKLVSRTFAIAALALATAFSPITQAQSPGQPYLTLNQAQPSDTPGKIEVLEFFAYSCVHCATMEPMLQTWAKKLPENVVFKHVPVAFNSSMQDLQRLYYALEALDRMDLHEKVFNAIHRERKRIYEFKDMAGWLESQGVDRKQFEAAFLSFGINNKVARANELAKTYNIEGTPSIAVGGKYVTSPTMTNSYEATIEEAQRLVEMVNK